MARYTNTLRDQNLAPVAGAYVSVLAPDGSAAALTDDNGDAMPNPFLTDYYGNYTYNVATSGLYTNGFTFGGRLVFREAVPVGLEMLTDQIVALTDRVDEIDTIYADLTGDDTIGTVATNITEVIAVGLNIAAVLAVNADAADIGTVAANLTGDDTIGTVADNITEVAAVGSNIAAVLNADTNMAAIIDAPNQAALARAYAISDTDAPIAGAVSTDDRGAKYYADIAEDNATNVGNLLAQQAAQMIALQIIVANAFN